MTVKIIPNNENRTRTYEQVKKDYMENKLTQKQIIKKYNLNPTRFHRIQREIWKETGYSKIPQAMERGQHIIRIRGKYCIKKDDVYYGGYKHKKQANRAVKHLMENGWNVDEAEWIMKEQGVPLFYLFNNDEYYGRFRDDYFDDEVSVNDILRKYGLKRNQYYYYIRPFPKKGAPKYYFKEHGLFKVTKTIGKDLYYYGHYEEEETAKKIVEHLKKVDWDIKQLPDIKKRVL